MYIAIEVAKIYFSPNTYCHLIIAQTIRFLSHPLSCRNFNILWYSGKIHDTNGLLTQEQDFYWSVYKTYGLFISSHTRTCRHLNISCYFGKTHGTGKSFSEALILASTNPQFDNRLFIELRVQYIKIPSSEHFVYINCSECQKKNKKTILVHNMFWVWNFHVLNS